MQVRDRKNDVFLLSLKTELSTPHVFLLRFVLFCLFFEAFLGKFLFHLRLCLIVLPVFYRDDFTQEERKENWRRGREKVEISQSIHLLFRVSFKTHTHTNTHTHTRTHTHAKLVEGKENCQLRALQIETRFFKANEDAKFLQIQEKRLRLKHFKSTKGYYTFALKMLLLCFVLW